MKYGMLISTPFTIVVLLLWYFLILNATPDEGWQEKTKTTDTAILFGFGYVLDENGNMLPGEANQVLYDLAVANIGTSVLHLIMQEGVMVAALADTNPHTFTRDLIRMHPLIPGQDVNTLAAARYAIRKMDSLNVTSAVVYAHSMQLARAVYDLKRLIAIDTLGRNYEFFTPDIQSTPFPPKSAQWRTRCMLFYFPWELGGRVIESLQLNSISKSKEEEVLIMGNDQNVKQKGNSKSIYFLFVLLLVYCVVSLWFVISSIMKYKWMGIKIFTEKNKKHTDSLTVLFIPIFVLFFVFFIIYCFLTCQSPIDVT
jgi:hypothetical protein